MRRNVIHGVLVVLCIAATTEAVIILPMAKPKPGDTPDPTNVVIDLGKIRLGPKAEAQFVVPEDAGTLCIESVLFSGRLLNSSSSDVAVWFSCLDPQGGAVTTTPLGIAPEEFECEQSLPYWATAVVMHIQNMASKQVVIQRGSLAVTYAPAPDPATLALLAVGAAMLLVRRKL